MSRALDKRIADLEWAQGARITEAMDDPRLVALAAQLQAGVSIRTFSDDDLDYLIAWRRRQGGDAGIDVAAMSNEELKRRAGRYTPPTVPTPTTTPVVESAPTAAAAEASRA